MLCILVCGGWVQAQAADVVGTVRVIDGDTFDVGGTRVRLHGIDAPEGDQTCRSEQGIEWECGAWVTRQVADRYEQVEVRCETLGSHKKRTVARCFAGGEDIAEVLVYEGLAFADRRFSDEYDLAEKSAFVRDVGLHASSLQTPSWYRVTKQSGRIPPDPSCPIKGNINGKNERIYHVPGQRDYERTSINGAKEERWFCSAAEAEAAGWRAARR